MAMWAEPKSGAATGPPGQREEDDGREASPQLRVRGAGGVHRAAYLAAAGDESP
jgi:hypothetical protein